MRGQEQAGFVDIEPCSQPHLKPALQLDFAIMHINVLKSFAAEGVQLNTNAYFVYKILLNTSASY